ncbi:MAG: hypothetical protein AAF901_11015 [Bacteroidota bacterium]
MLFIIFAIRTNGQAVISHLGVDGQSGKFQSTASMPLPTEELEGKMISYRRIILKELPPELRNTMLMGQGWEWKDADGLSSFVEEVENDIILSIAFTQHPANLALELNLRNTSLYQVFVEIIEGSAKIGARMSDDTFNGACHFNTGEFARYRKIEKLRLQFRLTGADKCDPAMITFR